MLLYRYITSAELRRAMRALGFKCSREDAKQMIADVNLKGKRFNFLQIFPLYITHPPSPPKNNYNYIFLKMCYLYIFKNIKLNLFHLFSILFSQIEFTEFLEVVIDRQGDSRDMYDEILKGFSMFDFGKFFFKESASRILSFYICYRVKQVCTCQSKYWVSIIQWLERWHRC